MWKRIEAVAAVLAMLAFLTGWSLYFVHLSDDPRQPDPRAGRVVPQNIHGTFVYLTREEDRLQSACFWVFGLLAVTAAAVDVYKDPYNRRRRS